jgi:hypothetical protein
MASKERIAEREAARVLTALPFCRTTKSFDSRKREEFLNSKQVGAGAMVLWIAMVSH